MKVLIYKRTHKGDPDERGIFGNQDCMGKIRSWDYDAVIGIGGKTTWKNDKDIKQKINWIGLGPKKIESSGRADCVVFTHFELFEKNGKNIAANFPKLYDYMYGSRKRFDMSSNLPDDVFQEVEIILNSVRNSPQSKEYAIEFFQTGESSKLENSTCYRICIEDNSCK